jgi:hypothetical protein
VLVVEDTEAIVLASVVVPGYWLVDLADRNEYVGLQCIPPDIQCTMCFQEKQQLCCLCRECTYLHLQYRCKIQESIGGSVDEIHVFLGDILVVRTHHHVVEVSISVPNPLLYCQL